MPPILGLRRAMTPTQLLRMLRSRKTHRHRDQRSPSPTTRAQNCAGLANVSSSASCSSPPTSASTLTNYTYSTNGQRLSAATTTSSGGGSISAVGTLQQNLSSGTTTLAVDPQHVGDALVLAAAINSAATITAVSGGGATWTPLETTAPESAYGMTQLWLGTVTTTGSSTITVTYSTSVTGVWIDLSAQEYTNGTGSSTVWSEDTSGYQNPSSSSTSIALPSLSATSSGELYVGMAFTGGTPSAGSTSGFTYDTPSYGLFVYNPSSSGTVAPTATQSPASVFGSVAALIKASGSSTSTTNYGWNAYGELCNVSTAAVTACGATPSTGDSYTYNGDGLRMSTVAATSGTTTSTVDSSWDAVTGAVPLNVNDATTTSGWHFQHFILVRGPATGRYCAN